MGELMLLEIQSGRIFVMLTKDTGCFETLTKSNRISNAWSVDNLTGIIKLA